MKIKKLFFIIIFLFPTFLFGDNTPGYLGKKTLIGATICYMPDFYSSREDYYILDYENNQKSIWAPPLIYNFQVSRVIKPKVELGFQMGFYRYGIIGFDKSIMTDFFLTNGNLVSYSRASTRSYKVISRFSLDFKSPIGNYFGVGLSRLIQDLQLVDKMGNFQKLSKESDIGICYEYGTRRHIGHNFILDLGLEGAFYLAANNTINNASTNETYIISQTFEMNKKIYYRRNLANFKLGLNYIF